LKATPSRVSKIFVQREQGPHRLGEVLKEARNGDVPFVFVPREKLDRMAMHHQGVVAFLAPKAYSSLEDLLAGPGIPFLVLLDEVEDPQNVGAIVRSAEAAGAGGLVLPERRSAGLTEAVATVSAGALAHLKVARVANLAQAMEDLKRAGVWLVGAEGGTPETFESFDYTVPVGIVLGSEGHGLRTLVRKRCDKVLSIPMAGHVNSLNVASAAAVFLFEVARQRRAKAPVPPAG
jgi:23S rRNA (guanosine2251-2'-O)-methyltransferase